MDINQLYEGREVKSFGPVDVCYYDKDDCLMPDAVNLPTNTVLAYVGPDKEDGQVFQDEAGTKYCLHDNDLLYFTFVAQFLHENDPQFWGSYFFYQTVNWWDTRTYLPRSARIRSTCTQQKS